MIFKYKSYGHALRPVIPVTILYKNAHVDYEVLVDSGSDHCFFDSEIGEDIGITRGNSEIKEVFGVGGKISIYHSHKVTLKIGEQSFETEVGFMPNLGGSIVSYGIVGQKGFFDKFIIKFDYINEEVEITDKKSHDPKDSRAGANNGCGLLGGLTEAYHDTYLTKSSKY